MTHYIAMDPRAAYIFQRGLSLYNQQLIASIKPRGEPLKPLYKGQNTIDNRVAYNPANKPENTKSNINYEFKNKPQKVFLEKNTTPTFKAYIPLAQNYKLK